jgi:hypothetical protein
MCVLTFSTTFAWKHFSFHELSEIRTKMHTGLHVKYLLFLSDWGGDLEKQSNIKFHENPSSGSLIVTYGWTDTIKLKWLYAILWTCFKMCNFISFYLSSIAREFQCKSFDSQNIDCVVEMNKITTILRFKNTSCSCQMGWCGWSRGWLCNGQCTGWADPILLILACKSKCTIH